MKKNSVDYFLKVVLQSSFQCLLPVGVAKLLVSLGHTGGRRVVLGHTLNMQTLMKTDEQKKILSKCAILCWAAFIAIPGRMRPAGRGLVAPDNCLGKPRHGFRKVDGRFRAPCGCRCVVRNAHTN